MLVDLDLDEVVVRALVIRPHLPHREANPVEHALRLAAEAVGELFRIGESAADALDDARLAADVPRRAAVAGRIARSHSHAIAGVEAAHRRRRISAGQRHSMTWSALESIA